jgi:hypothetical protein
MTDLTIRTSHGTEALLEDKEIKLLASGLRGPLLGREMRIMTTLGPSGTP